MSRTFLLNKLVRDNLVAMMQAANQDVEFRSLKNDEYVTSLRAKVVEEALELQKSTDADLLSEIADLQSALEALAKTQSFTQAQITKEQHERHKKRGGFEKRLFVDTVTVEDEDPWASYYAAEPDKYREVL